MKKTIYEGDAGVLWRKGKIQKVLGNGRHRYSLWRGEKITTVNTQTQEYTCQVQDYATKDNLTVRFMIRLRVQVSDPAAFLRALPENTHGLFVQNAASDAARVFVAKYSLEDLLGKTVELREAAQREAGEKLREAGMEITELSPVSILIPRSLRQAYEAELVIKKKALAELEEARGRTAVLRHLANAATMVEKQPVLLQLLMGQKARQVQFQFDTTKRGDKK